MVRFYCDYCNSYLTHDATSVRKNHLTGRAHVQHVCDYFEGKAKELGIWTQVDASIEITTEKLFKGIPGSHKTPEGLDHYKLAETKTLPPPPTLPSLPPPPPSVLHESRKDSRELIGNILRTIS